MHGPSSTLHNFAQNTCSAYTTAVRQVIIPCGVSAHRLFIAVQAYDFTRLRLRSASTHLRTTTQSPALAAAAADLAYALTLPPI